MFKKLKKGLKKLGKAKKLVKIVAPAAKFTPMGAAAASIVKKSKAAKRAKAAAKRDKANVSRTTTAVNREQQAAVLNPGLAGQATAMIAGTRPRVDRGKKGGLAQAALDTIERVRGPEEDVDTSDDSLTVSADGASDLSIQNAIDPIDTEIEGGDSEYDEEEGADEYIEA